MEVVEQSLEVGLGLVPQIARRDGVLGDGCRVERPVREGEAAALALRGVPDLPFDGFDEPVVHRLVDALLGELVADELLAQDRPLAGDDGIARADAGDEQQADDTEGDGTGVDHPDSPASCVAVPRRTAPRTCHRATTHIAANETGLDKD